ncbi:hypothetical protein OAN307_c45330 [Octadecabacter antarcticus 307]|uniref:Uncharacterized protein n=1 Tax=Octadecabacter antarcticus 307 TaxID=391626 RepID=M9RJ90_9RHOB|nr:hypothetical protein OAN307_c45330 [Octadecabacter antarcticus 307]
MRQAERRIGVAGWLCCTNHLMADLCNKASWTHLSSIQSPTPKSDETCGRVKPLLIAMRTASRRNLSVYPVAIPFLIHRKHCLKETGTKTAQNHAYVKSELALFCST